MSKPGKRTAKRVDCRDSTQVSRTISSAAGAHNSAATSRSPAAAAMWETIKSMCRSAIPWQRAKAIGCSTMQRQAARGRWAIHTSCPRGPRPWHAASEQAARKASLCAAANAAAAVVAIRRRFACTCRGSRSRQFLKCFPQDFLDVLPRLVHARRPHSPGVRKHGALESVLQPRNAICTTPPPGWARARPEQVLRLGPSRLRNRPRTRATPIKS